MIYTTEDRLAMANAELESLREFVARTAEDDLDNVTPCAGMREAAADALILADAARVGATPEPNR